MAPAPTTAALTTFIFKSLADKKRKFGAMLASLFDCPPNRKELVYVAVDNADAPHH
jgi:hypothetical protein